MFLWFVGPSVAIVWLVFRSPMADHRVVALGALLPLGEAAVGGPWILHTLVGACAVMGGVMLVTRNRRLVRRRWLGIPIGMFLHLVLDGSFTRADQLWWPFLGWEGLGGGVPELDRSVPLVLVLELLGAAACWWCWQAFDLSDPERRRLFVRTGQVDRALLPPAA